MLFISVDLSQHILYLVSSIKWGNTVPPKLPPWPPLCVFVFLVAPGWGFNAFDITKKYSSQEALVLLSGGFTLESQIWGPEVFQISIKGRVTWSQPALEWQKQKNGLYSKERACLSMLATSLYLCLFWPCSVSGALIQLPFRQSCAYGIIHVFPWLAIPHLHVCTVFSSWPWTQVF